MSTNCTKGLVFYTFPVDCEKGFKNKAKKENCFCCSYIFIVDNVITNSKVSFVHDAYTFVYIQDLKIRLTSICSNKYT